MTFIEAYEKALQQIPRDYRWFQADNGEWYQQEVNEPRRRCLAYDIMKASEL